MEVYNVYCFSCLFSMTLSCKQKKRKKTAKGQQAGIQNECSTCKYCMEIRTLQQAHSHTIFY